MAITDSDFLANPSKQLEAVQHLAELRTQLVALQTDVLKRMHERRALIQRLADSDLAKQGRQGRSSSDFALKRARASDEVKQFDAEKRQLTERIQHLKIDIERHKLSIVIAIGNSEHGTKT